ncbi:hypothetical protein ACFXO2_10675, partial [Streptomyces sp. NPDC059152]
MDTEGTQDAQHTAALPPSGVRGPDRPAVPRPAAPHTPPRPTAPPAMPATPPPATGAAGAQPALLGGGRTPPRAPAARGRADGAPPGGAEG